MRIMKKLLVLVMATLMLAGVMSIAAFGADEVDYTEAARKLGVINIMKGDTSGNLMLENGVTRYQAALFFVQAITGETAVEKWNEDKQSAVFGDVPEYGTAIDYANGIGLIKGRGDGTYGYNDPITYQDMLVLAVRALGYETEGMAYPSGYITAAKKLKLTEKLATGIANTQALTRGETAQIIWNMMGIQIAVKDPVTDKILYPFEESVGLGLFGGEKEMKRTTLLETAGFTQTVIETEIVKYTPAKTSKDVATVTLENGMEIAASEFAITARTNQSTFLGLPVTLYVDSKSADAFEQDYSIDPEENEATIVFIEFLAFADVKNIGNEGNIKVTETTSGEKKIVLGENTFAESKYEFDLRVLSEDGWESEDIETLYDAFSFKDGEYTGTNSYGEISYAVKTETDEDEDVTYTLIMLYKPYEFGQYFTRTIRYQPLVSDESFITIGKYDESAVTVKEGAEGSYTVSGYKNPSNEYTYFVEELLGSDEPIMANGEIITSVSKQDGEAAREAKISGGSVRGGDFIFYYYNELDNVLVIGQNCGGLKKGTLKSQNATKETVKIDNTTYDFGFSGAFTATLPEFDDFDFMGDYVSNVSTEANAEYVAVDNEVLFVQRPLNLSNHRVKHNYVIATVNPNVMADLLDMEVDDYEKKLTEDGVYVAESGNMQIAVLNTANGKWGLAEVSQYEYGTLRSTTDLYHNNYNHEEAEWENVVDMQQSIEYYDVFGENFKGYDKYAIARDALLHGGMFAVRGNAGGVYKLCVMFHPDDYGMINNGKVTDGLYFSDMSPKTNAVKAVRNDATEAARVTLTANTVVVVIDKAGNVGVRVGIQGAENSIILDGITDSAPAYFYSASAKLIVLQLPLGKNLESKIKDANGEKFDVLAWADEAAAGADETYYVGLNDAGVEYDRLDDGTYELTVSGLFNLRTMRTVAAIKLSVEDLDETDIEDENLVGKVLHMDKKGKLTVSDKSPSAALAESVNMRSDKDEEFYEITASNVEFADESSITIKIGDTELNKRDAVNKINVTVATLDITDIDWDKYDVSNIVRNVTYDADADIYNVGSVQFSENKNDLKFAYTLSDLNAVENITEPAAGIIDQYIIDTMGNELLFAEQDGEYFEDAASAYIDMYACGQFDEDTGIVTLYVVKVLTNN